MLHSAECVRQFSDEALVGVSQAPSPQDVLVTVQQEGVICYDALLKVRFGKSMYIESSSAAEHRLVSNHLGGARSAHDRQKKSWDKVLAG